MDEQRMKIVSWGPVDNPPHPAWTVQSVTPVESNVDELMAFVRACLDADERGDGFAHCDGCEGGGPEYIGTMHECDIDAARARVLREVESRRALIADCEEYHGKPFGQAGAAVTDGLSVRVLQYLALPFADRVGYQESWRP